MSERNQCDGCALGMVVNENGNHVNASGRIHMDCTRDRYEASETEQLRARVAELEAALRSARSELAALASYVDDPAAEWPNAGLRLTAKAHAREVKRIDAALSGTASALDALIAAAVRAEREACAESAAAAPIRCAHVTCHACRNPAAAAIRARGEGTHSASCRTVTGKVNDGYCVACRREATERERGMYEPFCTCGRRVSECDGSRAGCGKSPSIRARGESLTEAPSPMRHVVNEHGDCAHWCEACYHERRARGES